MTETARWLVKAGRRDDAIKAVHRVTPEADADDEHRRDRGVARAGRRPGVVGRGVQPLDAQAADHRGRAGGVPADHGDQRHHLLRRPDLRLRRVRHAARPGRRHDLGHRRRQRARDLRRRGLRRPLRTQAAAAHRAGRHGRFADGRRLLLREARRQRRTKATSMAGIFTLVALVVFIASFAFSLGPVVWTIINEIFPNRVRGRAVAVATAANWGTCVPRQPVLPDAASTTSASRPRSGCSPSSAPARSSSSNDSCPRRRVARSKRSRPCGLPSVRHLPRAMAP